MGPDVGIYSNLMSQLGVGKRKEKRAVAGARDLVIFSDAYIVEHFARLGYAVAYDQLAFTLEPVADFVTARETLWHRPGNIRTLEIAGLLIVEDAQPRALQPTRDIVVVSLGDARVVMGVINRQGRNRYAETM
ncbi:MAG: hypothetical protein ABW213_04070 [Tardiphaga sp.]